MTKSRVTRLEERFEELTARVQALKMVERSLSSFDARQRLRRKQVDAQVALEQCTIMLDRARSQEVL